MCNPFIYNLQQQQNDLKLQSSFRTTTPTTSPLLGQCPNFHLFFYFDGFPLTTMCASKMFSNSTQVAHPAPGGPGEVQHAGLHLSLASYCARFTGATRGNIYPCHLSGTTHPGTRWTSPNSRIISGKATYISHKGNIYPSHLSHAASWPSSGPPTA